MSNKVMTVRELRDELIKMPVEDWDLPVYLFDVHTDEAYPLERVDPTISDRVDLNFSSEQKKTYHVHAAVYHSFRVEALNEEEAMRVATEDVKWNDYVTDCEINVEEA